MEFVKSPSSKSKISRFIRQREKDQLIDTAKQSINTYLGKLKLPPLFSKEDKISQTYTQKELESKFLEVIDKKITILQFIKTIYADKINALHEEKEKNKLKSKEHTTKKHLISSHNEYYHNILID